MKMRGFATVLCLGGLLLAATPARAADTGTDDASAAAYADGWDNFDDGSTGGDGMGAWLFGSGANAGTVAIESSLGLGAGSGAIDAAGKAFKIHDSGGGFVDMFRFFDPAPGLDVGQTFSLDMAVNFRGGFKGIDLRDSGENTIFNLNIGGDDYTVSQAETGNGSLGNAYASETVFHLEFEQTTLGGGVWRVTRSGGVTDFDSGTYTGQPRSIKLYSGGQGTFAEDAIYYNNFAVIPEPASLMLIGLAGIGLLRRR